MIIMVHSHILKALNFDKQLLLFHDIYSENNSKNNSNSKGGVEHQSTLHLSAQQTLATNSLLKS